jgi:glucitol/sorbitol PTS system EIIA component
VLSLRTLKKSKHLSQIVYSTTVTAVGELVSDFADQGVLVFFGKDAPIELHEFSIIHKPDVVDRAPQVGDTITLQENVYSVLAVGSVASDNLLNLGHLDLKANGLTEPEMPGDVNVEAVSLPKVNVGDRLIVTSQTK